MNIQQKENNSVFVTICVDFLYAIQRLMDKNKTKTIYVFLQ